MKTVRREDIEELLKEKRLKEKKETKFQTEEGKRSCYVKKIEDNLLENIKKEYFEDDVGKGRGEELKNKFFSIASSAALVVNTFAIFKSDKNYKKSAIPFPIKDGYEIPAGYDKFSFEKKYENGLGRNPEKTLAPPHLDIVFEWGNEILAIEAKFLEPLTSGEKSFSDTYREKIVEGEKDRSRRMKSKWGQLLEERIKDGEAKKYQYLDDTQLIKHAMGLLHDPETKDKKISLCYLYWEPENANEIKEFSKHREEIEDFAKDVGDDAYLHFFPLSYDRLWKSWDSKKELSEHVTNLKNWYSLTYP